MECSEHTLKFSFDFEEFHLDYNTPCGILILKCDICGGISENKLIHGDIAEVRSIKNTLDFDKHHKIEYCEDEYIKSKTDMDFLEWVKSPKRYITSRARTSNLYICKIHNKMNWEKYIHFTCSINSDCPNCEECEDIVANDLGEDNDK